jgi:hypothetical protein
VNAYSLLRSLFNKRILRLDLESNNIRTGGGTDIPDFLAGNPPLTHLHLAKNHLDDSDAILIARALKRNTNLEQLVLAQNDITDTGRDALRKVIFDSTSLNALAASNHSCQIWGIDLDDVSNNRRDHTSVVNRGRKIYSLLSSRHWEGTNVHHLDAEFEDDSLKLVSNILECVHIYAEDASPDFTDAVCPLSIMYEILRSWKMPTLYENYRGHLDRFGDPPT